MAQAFGGIAGVPLLSVAINHLGFSGRHDASALAMILVVDPRHPGFCPPTRRIIRARRPQSPPRMVRHPRKPAAAPLRDFGFLSVSIAFALVLCAQVGFIVHLISFLDR